MWTQFMDMYSGGESKEKWKYIYIQAPAKEAKVIFYNRFGHSPERVSCTCCGEDYSISESPTLEQASAYDRGRKYENGKYVEKPNGESWKKFLTIEEYSKQKDVLIIHADEIKDTERLGEVPEEGYVWV